MNKETGGAPETIWAEPDGDEILIHNGAEDLDQLIHTGYLYEYTRTDLLDKRMAEAVKTALRHGALSVPCDCFMCTNDPT